MSLMSGIERVDEKCEKSLNCEKLLHGKNEENIMSQNGRRKKQNLFTRLRMVETKLTKLTKIT